MSRHDASDLARRLGLQAEAVCRHYLSAGRREGRYWLVGDVRNTPGRSMFVRLRGPASGKGAAGKWTDAATGEHGDMLDVIREACGLIDFKDVADEARRFLSLPHPEPEPEARRIRNTPAPTGSPEAAQRLFAMAQPIPHTLAEAYLRNRGITALHETSALRFHPRCYYRPDEHEPTEIWPAMIAAALQRPQLRQEPVRRQARRRVRSRPGRSARLGARRLDGTAGGTQCERAELAVDGWKGPKTTAAIAEHQTRAGLPVTGLPDEATLASLGLEENN